MQPYAEITRWKLLQVKHADGRSARHLVGRSNHEGRLTSEIVELDVQFMRATSKSGRHYKIVGPPSEEGDRDGMWLYKQWSEFGNRMQQKDLSVALLRLSRMRQANASITPGRAKEVEARMLAA